MNNIVITSDFRERIRKIRADESLSKEKKSFEVKSCATYNDFPAIDAAAFYALKVEISTGEVFDFTNMSKFDAAVKRMELAGNADKEYAIDQLAYIVADAWKVNFFKSDLEDLSKKISEAAKKVVDKKILGREISARLSHTHTKSAMHSVNNYSMYKEYLVFSQKVIVLNGAMASGKTEAMRQLYSEARDAGLHPIFITSKRSIAANFFDDSHDDHYKSQNHEARKGVIGVVNSIVGDKYEEDRKKCKVVFIDEFEDTMDHISVGTIGEIAADRIDALQKVSDLISKSEKTFIADAMITDHSIDMLSEMSGDEVKIIKAGKAQTARLSLGTKDEILGLAKKRMLEGKRVAIFMDYNAKDFSQVAEALADGTDKKVIKLNSEYFEQNGKSLSDLEEILKSSDAAIISPVVNAGSSITDEAYDEVFVLAGRTLTPTGILQSTRRFRAAKTIYLAFRGGRSSARITNPLSMMAKIVGECEDPVGVAQQLYATKFGKYIADHAAAKNLQFRNFQQTLLIAAEQMGFRISRPWINDKIKEEGSKASKAGRKKNKEKQLDKAFETSEKVKNNQREDVNMGTSEERSFEQQVAARTVAAMDLLNLKEINEQTYSEIFEMNIDSVVSMRRHLSQTDILPERFQIAAKRVVELLSDAGVNLENIRDSYITSESAVLAYERLIEHVALNEKASSTGLELVKMFCEEFDINVVSSLKGAVIKNILRGLGYDMKAMKKGRIRYYNVVDLEKKVSKITKEQFECKETKVACNITKVADKYHKLNLKKEHQNYSMSGITPYGVFTQDEKCLAKTIEARKNHEYLEYDYESDYNEEE